MDQPEVTGKGMDDELKLIGQLNRKLETLDDDARCRVLTYLWDRHMTDAPPPSPRETRNGCKAVALSPDF